MVFVPADDFVAVLLGELQNLVALLIGALFLFVASTCGCSRRRAFVWFFRCLRFGSLVASSPAVFLESICVIGGIADNRPPLATGLVRHRWRSADGLKYVGSASSRSESFSAQTVGVQRMQCVLAQRVRLRFRRGRRPVRSGPGWRRRYVFMFGPEGWRKARNREGGETLAVSVWRRWRMRAYALVNRPGAVFLKRASLPFRRSRRIAA